MQSKAVFAKILLGGWLVFQISMPFFLKFRAPDYTYRTSRFAWGMFGSLTPRYQLSLTMDDGQPIPEVDSFVYGIESPGWMEVSSGYETADEVTGRLERLIRHIASERDDGRAYSATVRWHYPKRSEWKYTWPEI